MAIPRSVRTPPEQESLMEGSRSGAGGYATGRFLSRRVRASTSLPHIRVMRQPKVQLVSETSSPLP